MIGETVTVPRADSAAHLAAKGFDFPWIKQEHRPITPESRRDLVPAARGVPAPLFARVPASELWQTKRAPDAGPGGSDLSVHLAAGTGAGVRRGVQASRGEEGTGVWAGVIPAENQYDRAGSEFLEAAVIEEAGALAATDEIAAALGIDARLTGTSGLSTPPGRRGVQEPAEPEGAIAPAARRHGKFPGRPAVPGVAGRGVRAEGLPVPSGGHGCGSAALRRAGRAGWTRRAGGAA